MSNDNSEKKLSDVIIKDKSKFDGFAIELRGDDNESWKSDDRKTFEELLNFLSQYKLKKIKDSDVVVNNVEGLDLFLLSKGKTQSSVFGI